jgi:hypothetical protein
VSPLTRHAGSLVQWFRDQGLLRGPYLFIDYWANVLGIDGVTPDDHARRGFIDPALFKLGIDRPEMEVPRMGSYLLLFLAAPILFALRSFRRLGRYRLRIRGGRSQRVLDALDRYRLTLDPAGREPDEAGDPDLPRRCDVRLGDLVLARDVLDPYRVAGYSSLFWAANKLPLASLMGLLVVAITAPLLSAFGMLELTARLWVPLGFPLLVVVLYLLLREWLTAILGGVPILLGTVLIGVLDPSTPNDWSVFFWALAGIFGLFLLADWFFSPRPVPPALLLYSAHGPAHPYRRQEDAPWWLEGETYWVWRYLLLSRAELNKFWERDWERVDLWIRADGPDAGRLEWVVTDLHYRELWVPYDKLGEPASLRRQEEKARAAVDDGAGIWLVEMDADLVFHSPMFRGVSFLTDRGGVPVRGLNHVARALWRRVKEKDVSDAMGALTRLRMERGIDVLGDIPEIISRRAEVRLVEEPWTYWRYPLGAASRRQPWLYEELRPDTPPAAADRSLQIKAP